MARWSVHPDREPPREVVSLAERVERDGGRALAVYQDPVGERWQIFCLLPMEKVEPTPYQRDLSRAHVKRLQEVVKKIDRFVDPITAISPRPGLYWTPNGSHRRAVLEKLKSGLVPAILVPEPEVAFQILALLERLREVPLQELVDPAQDRRERPAREPLVLLVEEPERDEVGRLELEGIVLLAGGRLLVDQPAIHADDLEGLLLEVVRLLGVEREDLEGDLRLRDQDRGDHLGLELAQDDSTVIAVRGPVDPGLR